MIKIRRLNSVGMEKFNDHLVRLREGHKEPPPYEILKDTEFAETVQPGVEIDEAKKFPTRFDLGQYLVDLLATLDQTELFNDKGLWSWIALLYFDQLCPAEQDGSRKPKENYNYILSGDYRHRERHAVRTTYMFVRNHGDTVQFMFSKPLHQRGEIIEQLSQRQDLLSTEGIIKAAHLLYADTVKKTFKRGAAGKNKGGEARRLVRVLQQFETTYDLFSMTGEKILLLLPSEFNRFKPSHEAG